MSISIVRVSKAAEIGILLERHRGAAKVLAGGTDVLVQIRNGNISPSILLDISQVGELRSVEFNLNEVSIGAGVSLSELVESEEIKSEFPSIWAAAKEVGSEQIRNLATIGGNLANGSPAADLTPPLVSLDAELSLLGPEGSRRIAVVDLVVGPGQTRLGPSEIIHSVHIPRQCERQGDVFIKVGKRKALAISVANVSASVCLSEDRQKFESVQLAFGSVGPKVVRAFVCEEALRGRSIDNRSIELALKQLDKEISPIDDIRATARYRRIVCKRIAKQAVQQAVQLVQERS
jgi:CO/xanthine dehydrogenase FAD-binding subunit